MLEKAEKISKIASYIAVPLIIAIIGWIIQDRITNENIKRDYVQLSVSIINDTENDTTSNELRSWAVDLLNTYSPVKFSSEVIAKLKAGDIRLLHEFANEYEIEGGIDISPDNKRIIIGGDDGSVSIYDLGSTKLIRSIKLIDTPIKDVIYDSYYSDGTHVWVASNYKESGHLFYVDFETWENSKMTFHFQAPIIALSRIPNEASFLMRTTTTLFLLNYHDAPFIQKKFIP